MDYSVNLLMSAADCDLLIELAGKEKSDLTYRKGVLDHQATTYTATAAEVDSELQAVTAEAAALTSLLPSLPEGATKDDNTKKLKKLEYRQFLLAERKTDFGSLAVLQKQLESAMVAKELEEADAFITALQTRKSQF